VPLIAADRLLFHFNFNWLAMYNEAGKENMFKTLKTKREVRKRSRVCLSFQSSINQKQNRGHFKNPEYIFKQIVQRQTSIACIFKMANTKNISPSRACPGIWASQTNLQHRRTLFVYNKLYRDDDKVPFSEMLSPESGIWPCEYEGRSIFS
jgi:hypothetical protein